MLWKMRFSDAKISPASAAQVAGDDFNARGLRFHNSAWSFRIARKLACGSPCLIGLTPRCFAHRARASCAPRGSSRFAAFDARRARLRYSLPYWAYYGLHPPQAAAFVRPFCQSLRHGCAVTPPFTQGRLDGRLLGSATSSGCATFQKAPLSQRGAGGEAD